MPVQYKGGNATPAGLRRMAMDSTALETARSARPVRSLPALVILRARASSETLNCRREW
jgi:hypothetical protein